MIAAIIATLGAIVMKFREQGTKDHEIESTAEVERERLQLELGKQVLQSVSDRLRHLETEAASLRQHIARYDAERRVTERLVDDAVKLFTRVVEMDVTKDHVFARLVKDVGDWLLRVESTGSAAS